MYKKLYFILIFAISACSTVDTQKCNNQLASIKLRSIEGDRMPDKLTFELQQKLKEAFVNQAQDYSLDIKYSTSKGQYQTQQDSTYQRVRSELALNYRLFNAADKLITNGIIRSSDSFAVSTSTYSDLVSEEETNNRLTDITVEKLKFQIFRDLQCSK